MKADVVIVANYHTGEVPLVFDGICKNLANIARVILVNDGPLTSEFRNSWERCCDGRFPLLILDHEKDGFGVARSSNIGMREATTEYVVHLGCDIVLESNTLQLLFKDSNDEAISIGMLDELPELAKLDTSRPLSEQVVRKDWRQRSGAIARKVSPLIYPQLLRDGFCLYPRELFLDVGGYDESNKTYGFQDYNLLCSVMEYLNTPDVITITNALALHIGGAVPGRSQNDKEINQVKLETINRRLATLGVRFNTKHGSLYI